jgi:UDP-N-acetylglucosamine 2-epimerase (non-hydrolysing)
MMQSHVILTDSGGLQEEAPALRVPVLVLRQVTERPEGVAAGVAEVVGTAAPRIVDAVARLLEDECRYRQMASGVNPYGDGRASQRIVRGILERHVAGIDERRPAGPPDLRH